MRDRCVSPEQLRQDLRYRRLTERLPQLAPRTVGEALLAVTSGRDPIAVLEELTRFSPELVRYVGARDWPARVWSVA
jgi:hypothetical protein